MAEESFEQQSQLFFPKATRGDWKKIAVQETNGKDPFETLSWRGKDDIRFLPYYDAQDTAALPRAIPAEITHPTHSWLNLPAVHVLNNDSANEIARQHLARGANGVFVYLDQHAAFDMDTFISGLDAYAYNLFLRFDRDQHFRDAFPGRTIHTLLDRMNAALFWEEIPKISTLSELFEGRKNLLALGLVIPSSTPAHEIARALVQGVRAYEFFEDAANAIEVFRSIAFSVTADVSFLESAAKIKALRSLWLQVARAYGHNSYSAGELHIHARSPATTDNRYAPHENMLRATFAAMAATAAGCDSLTIEGADDTPLFQRWSTNVSHILREESFFGRVEAPLDGAYAIEVMTDAIAQKAWEIFQQNVKA